MQPVIQSILNEVEKVLSGKSDAVRRLLTAALADGHILLDDVPGVGKTTLAVALGKILGLKSRRIQFTPDVLPSDIVGFTVYDRESGAFLYRPGIASGANLLLGDEINRTSSKTQSALLEAMEERQVTVDGQTHPLEDPFIVIATQNNVGTAGTQMLPYAQMDRFMVRLTIGYPDYDAQKALLKARQGVDPMKAVEQTAEKSAFLSMRDEAMQVFASDAVLDYIVRLTMASREDPALEIGLSPRASLCLDRMAKVRAWMEERDYVLPQDVQDVALDVCAHRVIPAQKSRLAGLSEKEIVGALLARVKVPDRHA